MDDPKVIDQSMGNFLRVANDTISQATCFSGDRPKTEVLEQDDSQIYSTLPTEEPDFMEIVIEFVPQLTSKLEEMIEAAEESDHERLAGLAHWLKGAGGTCGFGQFYEPSMELETAAKAKRSDRYEPLIGVLVQITRRIRVDESAATECT